MMFWFVSMNTDCTHSLAYSCIWTFSWKSWLLPNSNLNILIHPPIQLTLIQSTQPHCLCCLCCLKTPIVCCRYIHLLHLFNHPPFSLLPLTSKTPPFLHTNHPTDKHFVTQEFHLFCGECHGFLVTLMYTHPEKESDHGFTHIVDFVAQQWGHVSRPLYEIKYTQ